MSNKKSLRFLVVILSAAVATAALVFADPGAVAQNTNSGTAADAGAQEEERRTGDVSGEQTDLSGTYTGRVTMTGGHDMSGEGTLTITGNTFTLAVDTMTHNGRVYAVTTRGYVGAALYFSDVTDPATNTPVVANVRARKSGERLTLSPVPGSRTRLTFGTAAGTRGRRGRRAGSMNMGGGTGSGTGDNSNTGDATNTNTNSNTTPPM